MEDGPEDWRQPAGERIASIRSDVKNISGDLSDMRPKLDAVLLTVAEIKANQGSQIEAYGEIRKLVQQHGENIDKQNTRLVVLERAVHGTENTDGLVNDVAVLKTAKQHGDGSRFLLWKIISGTGFIAGAAAAIKTWFDSGHH